MPTKMQDVFAKHELRAEKGPGSHGWTESAHLLFGRTSDVVAMVEQDARNKDLYESKYDNLRQGVLSPLDSSEDWGGESTEELFNGLKHGDFDTKRYQEIIDELEAAGFGQKLRQLLGQRVNKRQRVQHECDGEWNYDRRLEYDPYQKMARLEHIERRITVTAQVGFHAGTNKKIITKWGSRVWAIVTMLENVGFVVGLQYQWCSSGGHRDDNKTIDTEALLTIKEPNEYMNPCALAATCSAGFFRRITLATMGMHAEAMGVGTGYGHGSAQTNNRAVTYDTSNIALSPRVESMDLTKLEDQVIEALLKHISGQASDVKMENYGIDPDTEE